MVGSNLVIGIEIDGNLTVGLIDTELGENGKTKGFHAPPSVVGLRNCGSAEGEGAGAGAGPGPRFGDTSSFLFPDESSGGTGLLALNGTSAMPNLCIKILSSNCFVLSSFFCDFSVDGVDISFFDELSMPFWDSEETSTVSIGADEDDGIGASSTTSFATVVKRISSKSVVLSSSSFEIMASSCSGFILLMPKLDMKSSKLKSNGGPVVVTSET